MKKIYSYIKSNYEYFLSIIISILAIISIFAFNKIYPFGNMIIFNNDMSAQYPYFLGYIRNIFLGNASPFYNFAMNLGSNAYGLISYYLTSPFNFILLLFKEANISEGILVLIIIKLSLCSLTMSVFLKNH